MLPLFRIKNLHPQTGPLPDQDPDARVRITAPTYDATISVQPKASLRYNDEEGDKITVGSSLELSQRLAEKPRPGLLSRHSTTTSWSAKPAPALFPLHEFEIDSGEDVRATWQRVQRESFGVRGMPPMNAPDAAPMRPGIQISTNVPASHHFEDYRIHHFNSTNPPNVIQSAVATHPTTNEQDNAAVKDADTTPAAGLTQEGKRQARSAGDKLRARGHLSSVGRSALPQPDRLNHHHRWASYNAGDGAQPFSASNVNVTPNPFSGHAAGERSQPQQQIDSNVEASSIEINPDVNAAQGGGITDRKSEEKRSIPIPPRNGTAGDKLSEKSLDQHKSSLLQLFETEMAKISGEKSSEDAPLIPMSQPSFARQPDTLPNESLNSGALQLNSQLDQVRTSQANSRSFEERSPKSLKGDCPTITTRQDRPSEAIEDGIRAAVNGFESCIRGIVTVLKTADPSSDLSATVTQNAASALEVLARSLMEVKPATPKTTKEPPPNHPVSTWTSTQSSNDSSITRPPTDLPGQPKGFSESEGPRPPAIDISSFQGPTENAHVPPPDLSCYRPTQSSLHQSIKKAKSSSNLLWSPQDDELRDTTQTIPSFRTGEDKPAGYEHLPKQGQFHRQPTANSVQSSMSSFSRTLYDHGNAGPERRQIVPKSFRPYTAFDRGQPSVQRKQDMQDEQTNLMSPQTRFPSLAQFEQSNFRHSFTPSNLIDLEEDPPQNPPPRYETTGPREHRRSQLDLTLPPPFPRMQSASVNNPDKTQQSNRTHDRKDLSFHKDNVRASWPRNHLGTKQAGLNAQPVMPRLTNVHLSDAEPPLNLQDRQFTTNSLGIGGGSVARLNGPFDAFDNDLFARHQQKQGVRRSATVATLRPNTRSHLQRPFSEQFAGDGRVTQGNPASSELRPSDTDTQEHNATSGNPHDSIFRSKSLSHTRRSVFERRNNDRENLRKQINHSRTQARKNKVNDCVEQLLDLGFGNVERSRLRVYAETTSGSVEESLDMLLEDRQAQTTTST